MGSWSLSIKIWILQAHRMQPSVIECIIPNICNGVKQNAKICAIGETECNEI